MRWPAFAVLIPSVALAQAPVSIATGQKSVGASQVQIVAARTRPWVDIAVGGPGECYFGPAGVTAKTGYPLRPGNSERIPTSAAVYAVCDPSATVSYADFPIFGG